MINVKFMVLTEDAKIAQGIITNAPSIEAARNKLEEAGAAVIYAEEATDEEVAEAKEIGGE